MRLLLGAALVGSAGLGFVAGRSSQPADAREDLLREIAARCSRLEAHLLRDAAAPEHAPYAVAAAGGGAMDMDLLRSELRKAVREELGTPSMQAEAPEPPPAPSAQSLAAFKEGQALVDEAIRTRRWREEDVLAMRLQLARMNAAERDEVIRKLLTSLNAGGIEVEVMGLPF